MGNPFLNRHADHGEKGRKSEKRVAKGMGGKQTPGSGALAGAKGDIKKQQFLIEAKATGNESYSVKYETLKKISREALEVSKYPALAVSFVTDSGQAKPGGDWVMVPAHVFNELVDLRPESTS